MNIDRLIFLLPTLFKKGATLMWLTLLMQLVKLIGPELKNALLDAVTAWEIKAKETPGPVDDFVAALLKALLS